MRRSGGGGRRGPATRVGRRGRRGCRGYRARDPGEDDAGGQPAKGRRAGHTPSTSTSPVLHGPPDHSGRAAGSDHEPTPSCLSGRLPHPSPAPGRRVQSGQGTSGETELAAPPPRTLSVAPRSPDTSMHSPWRPPLAHPPVTQEYLAQALHAPPFPCRGRRGPGKVGRGHHGRRDALGLVEAGQGAGWVGEGAGPRWGRGGSDPNAHGGRRGPAPGGLRKGRPRSAHAARVAVAWAGPRTGWLSVGRGHHANLRWGRGRGHPPFLDPAVPERGEG